MLSEYIAHRIQEIYEKAYNKLVLILASSAMASVLLSGLALLTSPAFKYLAVAVFSSGILLAERIHKRTLEKQESSCQTQRERPPPADTSPC